MDTIKIIDNDIIISFILKNNTIYYINYNNSIININDYINLLIMDNPTNFFNNNGEYGISYLKYNQTLESKNKIFRFKKGIVITTLSALLLFNSIYFNNPILVNAKIISNNSISYTTNYIKDIIYSSNYLTTEEKEYIYNSDFIEDLLPLINYNNYSRFKFDRALSNMSISSYDQSDEKHNSDLGYYNIDNPNVIHIKDYKDINDNVNKDTLSHEFIHLCQESYGYNLIIEASAEIISNEYYDNTSISTYVDQVILLKKLMEIIGPYPIWHYNFTGDFSLIKESVKPYLTSEEYNTFIDCLSFDYKSQSINLEKYKKLDNIISILYKNKYNDDIENNIIMKLLSSNDKTLVRSYFNQRLNESYYLDYENTVFEKMDLDTAINNEYVYILAYKKTEIDYEDAMKCIETEECGIRREIDNSYSKAIIYGTIKTYNKEYICCIIDGIDYEDVDVDELYEKGIIKAQYYRIDHKYLNAYEYINNLYSDYKIIISHKRDVIINDDYSVFGRVPTRVNLPTIFDAEQNKRVQ